MCVYDLLLFRWSPTLTCKIAVFTPFLFKTLLWLPTVPQTQAHPPRVDPKAEHGHASALPMLFLLLAFAQLLSDLGTFFPALALLQWLLPALTLIL